ncbi:hypothetical protein K2X33_01890, partial [bacterium]|nr:hypothetical protein [bacterium]
MRALIRTGTLLIAVTNIAVFAYFGMQIYRTLGEIPAARGTASVAEGGAAEHGAPAGHGETASAEHGAPAAEHGAPPAEHGAPAGGHGAPTAAAPAAPGRNWMAMDEMYVNIAAPADQDVHLMSFKLEMELFEDG